MLAGLARARGAGNNAVVMEASKVVMEASTVDEQLLEHNQKLNVAQQKV